MPSIIAEHEALLSLEELLRLAALYRADKATTEQRQILSAACAAGRLPPDWDLPTDAETAAARGVTAEDVRREREQQQEQARRDLEQKVDRERAREGRANDLEKKAPSIRGCLAGALKLMEQRADGVERPMPTPWPGLNAKLGRGLWPGMHVLTGSTASGKTAFAMQLALSAAQAGHPVLYVGLELDRAQIVARLLALLLAEVRGPHVRPVHWSELYLGTNPPALIEAKGEPLRMLEALPIRLEEAPPGLWSANALARRVHAMREAYPADPDQPRAPLAVIDFLQLVGPSDPENKREDLRERISRAAYAAREAARRHKAAVLMLSSISRESGKGLWKMAEDHTLGTGDPSALVGLGKESGDIEFAADTVLTLASELREADQCERPATHLAVAKLRAGVPSWCRFRFNGSWFDELPDMAPRPLSQAPGYKEKTF
jgi:replicative DNA helicase